MLKPIDALYCTTIGATGKNWQLAILLFLEIGERSLPYDAMAFGATIKVCASAGLWQLALWLLTEMASEQLRKNAIVCSAAITACTRGEQWPDAVALFERMQSRQVDSDLVAHNAAMAAFGAGGRWLQSLRMLPPVGSSHSFGIAISACQDAAQWEAALQMLPLSETRVETNAFMYSAAISSCAKGSAWQVAIWLLSAMQLSRLESSLIAHNAAIAACEHDDQWQRALFFLDSLQHEQLRSNIITYSSTINACAKCGQWQKALQLFADLAPLRISPNIFAYGAVLAAVSDAVEWSQALALLGRLRAEGNLQMNSVAYNAAIRACERAGMWQVAVSLFEEMDVRRLAPDQFTGSTVAPALAASGKRQAASHFLSRLEEQSVQHEAIAYSGMVNACSKMQEWQPALAWLLSASSKGFCSNAIAVNAAVSACCESRWGWALLLLTESAQFMEAEELAELGLGHAVGSLRDVSQWQEGVHLAKELRSLRAELNNDEKTTVLSMAIAGSLGTGSRSVH
ncbi:unnamed protein product [Symbiodinium sp. CCMP2592]|nr:unnamed protein product [Symbiodinium sp. CCMP2592]